MLRYKRIQADLLPLNYASFPDAIKNTIGRING